MAEKDYRSQLLEYEQKVGEGYDRTLVTLSGGALGLSIAFIKDIIGEKSSQFVGYLHTAWVSWGISLTAILVAYYLGIIPLT